MNSNPVYYALALVAATLLLFPVAVALLAGWAPPGLRAREVRKPYAHAILCLYLQAPLNALPRMADLPQGVVTACATLGVACGGVAVAFLVRALSAGRRIATGGAR
ncbi:hypothetical protein [Streptomyces venezuelae]|uniref:hypothetical protein n=1 Tax=Streptomyces venezuelae TaxID=54571 RepID=UPI001239DD9C|nr:hypothetical protein [Streptomyces venezuelae]